MILLGGPDLGRGP